MNLMPRAIYSASGRQSTAGDLSVISTVRFKTRVEYESVLALLKVKINSRAAKEMKFTLRACV